jgi:hypothetical protein
MWVRVGRERDGPRVFACAANVRDLRMRGGSAPCCTFSRPAFDSCFGLFSDSNAPEAGREIALLCSRGEMYGFSGPFRLFAARSKLQDKYFFK